MASLELLPATLPFNLLVTAGDVAAALYVRRALQRGEPEPSRAALVAAAGLGFAAVGLAMVLGENNFGRIRLLSYAAFLHAPVFLTVVSALLGRRARRSARAARVAAVLLVLTAAYAFLVEPRWLEVRHVVLESGKLERTLTVAVIADLQTDHIGRYEEEVFARVREARPDLILLPGDFLQPSTSEERLQLLDPFRRLFRGLEPRLGAYAVRGNVEPGGWEHAFEGTGVVALSATTSLTLDDGSGEAIELTALSLADSFDTHLHRTGVERFHVVLGHGPDFALGEIEADLLIAGHTHGGQVRLPFFGPLMTLSRVPRSWAAGLTRLDGDRWLYVSRGVGMERYTAPRLRFLCRPELVLIEIRPRS